MVARGGLAEESAFLARESLAGEISMAGGDVAGESAVPPATWPALVARGVIERMSKNVARGVDMPEMFSGLARGVVKAGESPTLARGVVKAGESPTLARGVIGAKAPYLKGITIRGESSSIERGVTTGESAAKPSDADTPFWARIGSGGTSHVRGEPLGCSHECTCVTAFSTPSEATQSSK